MARPIFLTLSEVLVIHLDQIQRYGGDPAIRDLGLLSSAIAMPRAGTREQYFHEDLFEMAAAYPYHIVSNQPFIDGNKRTGSVTAIVFLALNGIDINADEREFEVLIKNVAKGKLQKASIAEFLRKNTI